MMRAVLKQETKKSWKGANEMKRKKYMTGALACLMAMAAMTGQIMAAEETTTQQSAEEGTTVLVQITDVDGDTVTGEIGTISLPEGAEERPQKPEGEEGERPQRPEAAAEAEIESSEGDQAERPEPPEGEKRPKPTEEEGVAVEKTAPDIPFESSGKTITFTVEEDAQLDESQLCWTEGMVVMVQLDDAGDVVSLRPAGGRGHGRPGKDQQNPEAQEVQEAEETDETVETAS